MLDFRLFQLILQRCTQILVQRREKVSKQEEAHGREEMEMEKLLKTFKRSSQAQICTPDQSTGCCEAQWIIRWSKVQSQATSSFFVFSIAVIVSVPDLHIVESFH